MVPGLSSEVRAHVSERKDHRHMGIPRKQTVKLTVSLFAIYRERLGTDALPVVLPVGSTVEALLHYLASTYPALAHLVRNTRVATNQEFADPSRILQECDEIALIPPVSGGAC